MLEDIKNLRAELMNETSERQRQIDHPTCTELGKYQLKDKIHTVSGIINRIDKIIEKHSKPTNTYQQELKKEFLAIGERYKPCPLTSETREAMRYDYEMLFIKHEIEKFKWSIVINENADVFELSPFRHIDKLVLSYILS